MTKVCVGRGFQRQGGFVIYLKRKSVVRQALSTLIGQAREKWTFSQGDTLDNKVRIDPMALGPHIQGRIKQLEMEQRVLRGLPLLELTYETDLWEDGCHQATADRIFEFLGLSRSSVAATTKRVGSDELGCLLTNADEVKLELAQLGFSVETEWPVQTETW